MASKIFLLSAVLAAVQIVPAIAGDFVGLVIDLEYARYEGYKLNDLSANVWNAIPYAAPPIGDLRWRPPVPIEEYFQHVGSPYGPFNATQTGPSCVQGNPVWSLTDPNTPVANIGSEDCLTVDIIAPTNVTHGKLLPVVVHIHGGGFTLGNSEWANGKALERHSGGAIVWASIQYRLGAYGFLASQAVMDDGTANAGLLDQRLGIEWVKQHISKFGGDPNQIVIEGGSAGGGSVTAQMMLYGAKAPAPFQAAMPEFPWWQPFHGTLIRETQYQDLLKGTNCSSLDCLRQASPDALSLASRLSYISGWNTKPKPLYAYGDFYYGPVVDGKIIPDYPSRMFSEGRFHEVPTLTTHSKFEGIAFSNSSMTTEEELIRDITTLFPDADDKFLTELFTVYPRSNYGSVFEQRQLLFGDFIINCPTRWIMEAVTAKGQHGYKLVFNAGSLLHAADSVFVYNDQYESSPGANVTLAQYMKDWFISFMVTHDPNEVSWLTPKAQKPIWPEYGSAHNTLVVNPQSIEQAPDQELGQKCDFWKKYPEITRNKKRRDLLARPIFT